MSVADVSILIVDADRTIGENLASQLGGRYRCSNAPTAEKAVGLLNFHHFNLVITNERLPNMSGLALCDFVKRTCPGTSVIVMSSKNGVWQRTVAKRLGAFDYVSKVSEPSKLLQVIEQALVCQPGQRSGR
jgi:DNA-binding NtrC family response regulator